MTRKRDALVSVVVASYNHRDYVEKAIESLAAQEYPSVEILVIDDGSTDGSGELLDELRGKYSFQLIRRENGGLVSLLNQAITEVRGEYVVFHASDDVSPPYRIRDQVAVLSRYPAAAFVSGNVEFVTEGGKNAGTLLPVSGKEEEFDFDAIFVDGKAVSSVASMYRASALKQMGSIDVKYRAEDPQIFLRLTRLGYTWIQAAGRPVIQYRMLFSSQSRTVMPLLQAQLVQLVGEYSDHPKYEYALAKARTGLFSLLAESDKTAALKLALTKNLNWISSAAGVGVVKLILPKRFHRSFKRAGR